MTIESCIGGADPNRMRGTQEIKSLKSLRTNGSIVALKVEYAHRLGIARGIPAPPAMTIEAGTVRQSGHYIRPELGERPTTGRRHPDLKFIKGNRNQILGWASVLKNNQREYGQRGKWRIQVCGCDRPLQRLVLARQGIEVPVQKHSNPLHPNRRTRYTDPGVHESIRTRNIRRRF